MALNIRKPSDFDLVVVGSKDTAWLKAACERAGGIYIDRDADPEKAADLLKGQTTDGPFAVVADKDAEQGVACAVSAIGRSVVIHCEDKILPLEGWDAKTKSLGSRENA